MILLQRIFSHRLLDANSRNSIQPAAKPCRWLIRLFLFSLPIFVFLLVRDVRNGHFRQYEENIAYRTDAISSSNFSNTAKRYKSYAGVIHVHTALGGHSTGRFRDLIEAAHSNALDFVIMTEHQSALFNPLKYTLDGKIGNTLFIAGTEQHIPRVGRVLIVGGSTNAHMSNKGATAHTLESARNAGSLVFMAYPERFSGKSKLVDGIEVLSLHSGMRDANPLSLFLDMLFVGEEYRSLVIAKQMSRPDKNLSYFDATARDSPLTLFPGSDAHSNIGVHLLGDATGHTYADFKLDAYQTVLAVSRLHILMKPAQSMDKNSIVEALRQGHAYIGTDIIGDTTGFGFYASIGHSESIMGDTVTLKPEEEISLHVEVPTAAKIILFRDGKPVHESNGVSETTLKTTVAGNYRVEVYRTDIGSEFRDTPWILSNPIYVTKDR